MCTAQTLYLVAARRTKDGRRWKAFFVFLAITAVLAAIASALLCLDMVFMFLDVRGLEQLMPCLDAVVFLVVLVVSLAGLRAGRDWLHWLGLGFLGGDAAASIAYYVCVLLLPFH